jgi:acetyl-CoA C-acetyltransferase
VNAHANGALNPAAMFRSAISEATYNHASLVVDPLNLFDIAPHADGAAALVLTRPERLPPNFTHPLVRISGSAMVNDRLALHDRLDLLDFSGRQTVYPTRLCSSWYNAWRGGFLRAS